MATMRKIIAKLAVEFDCQMHYACNHNSHFKPVFIGDVLERIEVLRKSEPFENTAMRWVNQIIVPWSKCGLSKSLQEIEECGYEEVLACVGKSYRHCEDVDCKGKGLRLKNPNAQALAEFINSIIQTLGR